MDLDWTSFTIILVAAYLVGTIPFGLLASKLCQTQDPRTTGSGNIGFTNVLRSSGRKAGIMTLLGDTGKGFLVLWIAQQILHNELEVLFVALAVILGHIFPIFLKFQGGKGVATALGALGGLDLAIGLSVTAVWLLMVGVFRYSSGGAIGAFLTLPIFAMFVFSKSQSFVLACCGISLVVLFRHKENMQRLMAGTEGKLETHSS